MGNGAAVKVDNLSVSYHQHKILRNISFSMQPRQLIGVIGPNGAGKSTLMKAITGLINIDKGEIKIMGHPVAEVRKQMAYVPQRNNIDMDFPVLVEDVVMMGRYPHLGWIKRPGAKDKAIVSSSLEQVGMEVLRKKQIGELSGGQQQRVFLARALAQDAPVLFLDEPFTGIDITSENIIISLLKNLKNQGKTVFVVYHDLHKAESYFDSLILINKKVIAHGSWEEVFQPDYLRKAYEGNVVFLPDNNARQDKIAEVKA